MWALNYYIKCGEGFFYLYLKRIAHLAINASLPCVLLKHIYIYTEVTRMIKKIDHVKFK